MICRKLFTLARATTIYSACNKKCLHKKVKDSLKKILFDHVSSDGRKHIWLSRTPSPQPNCFPQSIIFSGSPHLLVILRFMAQLVEYPTVLKQRCGFKSHCSLEFFQASYICKSFVIQFVANVTTRVICYLQIVHFVTFRFKCSSPFLFRSTSHTLLFAVKRSLCKSQSSITSLRHSK